MIIDLSPYDNFSYYCENQHRFASYEVDQILKIDLMNKSLPFFENCNTLNTESSETLLHNLISDFRKSYNLDILSYKVYNLNALQISSKSSFFDYLKDDFPSMIDFLFYNNANIVSFMKQCARNKNVLFLMFYS